VEGPTTGVGGSRGRRVSTWHRWRWWTWWACSRPAPAFIHSSVCPPAPGSRRGWVRGAWATRQRARPTRGRLLLPVLLRMRKEWRICLRKWRFRRCAFRLRSRRLQVQLLSGILEKQGFLKGTSAECTKLCTKPPGIPRGFLLFPSPIYRSHAAAGAESPADIVSGRRVSALAFADTPVRSLVIAQTTGNLIPRRAVKKLRLPSRSGGRPNRVLAGEGDRVTSLASAR